MFHHDAPIHHHADSTLLRRAAAASRFTIPSCTHRFFSPSSQHLVHNRRNLRRHAKHVHHIRLHRQLRQRRIAALAKHLCDRRDSPAGFGNPVAACTPKRSGSACPDSPTARRPQSFGPRPAPNIFSIASGSFMPLSVVVAQRKNALATKPHRHLQPTRGNSLRASCADSRG